MVAKLSSGVSVSGLYSTLLDSNRANIKAKDKLALLEENQKPIQSTIKTTLNDNYSASYLGDYIKVAFEDERSNQLVSVNLSTKNVLNLILNFKGENNFFLRSDGILRLNGEAQNFVSGWFDKVAYDMNLLGADSDKNGLVEGEELNDTFLYLAPYLYGNAKKVADITNYTFAGGDKISYNDSELRGLDIVRVIDASLNALLNEDKNADNKISFVEHFGSLKMALGNVEMGVNNSSNAEFNMLEFILEQLKKFLEDLLEDLQEGNTDIKQIATQQGLSALSEAELELFKSQNPLEYERLKNEQESAEFKAQNELKDRALSENLGLNLNENSGEILSENSNLNSSNELLTPAKQKALSLLEKALSQDLLAQIKSQNLKIIDLKV